MTINGYMHKQIVVYTFNGIQFSHKKWGNTDTCYNLGETWKHTEKETDTKCYILNDWILLYDMSRLDKSTETESTLVVAGRWGTRQEWGMKTSSRVLPLRGENWIIWKRQVLGMYRLCAGGAADQEKVKNDCQASSLWDRKWEKQCWVSAEVKLACVEFWGSCGSCLIGIWVYGSEVRWEICA